MLQVTVSQQRTRSRPKGPVRSSIRPAIPIHTVSPPAFFTGFNGFYKRNSTKRVSIIRSAISENIISFYYPFHYLIIQPDPHHHSILLCKRASRRVSQKSSGKGARYSQYVPVTGCLNSSFQECSIWRLILLSPSLSTPP